MTVRQAALAATLAVASLILAGGALGRSDAAVRVTVFGDSAATAMAYDADAKRTLGRGIDLRLEVAVCRRLGDLSCPYDGSFPSTASCRRRAARQTPCGRPLPVSRPST